MSQEGVCEHKTLWARLMADLNQNKFIEERMTVMFNCYILKNMHSLHTENM
jgi:hypothetical protein